MEDDATIRDLRHSLERLTEQRDAFTDVVLDYTVSVSALRSCLFDFMREPERFSQQEWIDKIKWYYDKTSTPDEIVGLQWRRVKPEAVYPRGRYQGD